MARQVRLMAIGNLTNPAVAAGTILTTDAVAARTLYNYFQIAHTGTTAERPRSGESDVPVLSAGSRFYDTTLAKLIVWDGAAWRDLSGSAV